VRILIAGVLAVLLGLAAAAYGWYTGPLDLSADTVDLSIEPGTSPKEVAQLVRQSGVSVQPSLLYGLFRLSGQARLIKAGNYELARGITPEALLSKLVRGEEALRSLTLVEGWNLRQLRQALRSAEQLRADTAALSDAELMATIGRPGVPPEGRFFRTPIPTPRAVAMWRCCSALRGQWTASCKMPGRSAARSCPCKRPTTP